MEVVVGEPANGAPRPRAGTGVIGETTRSRVIQDLVRQTRLGTSGYVYAVDARGATHRAPEQRRFHESVLGSSPGDQGAGFVADRIDGRP